MYDKILFYASNISTKRWELMINQLSFSKGFKDGVPIALGYLSVAFAFGMLAVSKNMPAWSPILISFTNFTGTGQFVGMNLIVLGRTYAEIACTLFIINIRYMLMSLSLSQKLSSEITLPQRLLIAFGNTDEIYAVSMQQNGFLNFRYMLGIITCSFSGWMGGTILGAFASNILPAVAISALGIALYAMFIAIIIPPARDSKPIAKIIIISVLISCLFKFVPFLSKVGSGWVIIICGVTSSALGAFFFPIGNEDEKEKVPNEL